METPIICYHCGEESGYDREYVRTLHWRTELRCQWRDKVVVPIDGIRLQSYCGPCTCGTCIWCKPKAKEA